jgi:hypothetical protein
VKNKTLDPPDYRRLYLCYVDQLVGRALSDIEGIPCSINEQTIFTCGNAYCTLKNMKSEGGCSNNSCESLYTWNPGGECQGFSDRVCSGQILPDECIRETQHPYYCIHSEPDPKFTLKGVSMEIEENI